MRFQNISAVIAALALSACASQVAYDHSSDNKTIGYLTVGWPASPILSQAGSNDNLTLFRQSNIEPAFMGAIGTGLEKAGYIEAPGMADGRRTDFLKSYPKPNHEDSYLDIVVTGYGYRAGAKGAPLRPWLVAKVRLVRAADAKVLMQNTVSYNAGTNDAVTVEPDPQYVFADRAALEKERAKASDGAVEAARKSGESVVGLLK